jgi:hypothetical protein
MDGGDVADRHLFEIPLAFAGWLVDDLRQLPSAAGGFELASVVVSKASWSGGSVAVDAVQVGFRRVADDVVIYESRLTGMSRRMHPHCQGQFRRGERSSLSEESHVLS